MLYFQCLKLVSMLRKQSSYKKYELNDFLHLKFCSLYIHVLRDFQNLCKKYIALLLKRLHSRYRDRKTNHYNVMNDEWCSQKYTKRDAGTKSQWGAGLGELGPIRCMLTPCHSLLPNWISTPQTHNATEDFNGHFMCKTVFQRYSNNTIERG